MARQSLAAIPPVAAAVLAMRQRTLTEAARWLASSRKSTGWRGDGVADDVGAAMLGRSSPVTERLLDPQVATVQGMAPEGTVFDAVIPLVRRWKLVLRLPLGAGIVGAALALTLPSIYTARTTFVPAVSGATPSLPGGVAALATQFGLNFGSGTSLSPDFF